jgi:hypothetical protein
MSPYISNILYDSLKGISPFSHEGLRDASWTETSFSPIFAGVRNHLRSINMSLLILFDTQVNILSHNISDTLAPLALLHLDDLATQGISRTHVTRLFSNLDHAQITTLDDISLLFDAPIARPTSHPWHRQKGRAPRTLQEIFKVQSSIRTLHTHFSLPNASVKQRKLLRILLHLFLERVLQSHAQDTSYDMLETNSHWGKIPKHIVHATVAYTDGSACKDGTRAGFGINFSGLPTCNVKSRIPKHHTFSHAEAYGVLTTLMLVQSNIDLSIYCDREPLVQ